jgi:hypothetical protein
MGSIGSGKNPVMGFFVSTVMNICISQTAGRFGAA